MLSSSNFPVPIGNNLPLVVIGGVNVLESIDRAVKIGSCFKEACAKENIPYIFKASFDKANRTSPESFRGPGLTQGLEMLAEIKQALEVPILTDVHEIYQVAAAAEVCDILQLPAFLARQTDLIYELANSGRPINIKKPQFLSPGQACNVVRKFAGYGCSDVIMCERGTCFGYDNLVVDILGIDTMIRSCEGTPICVDVTHALQQRKPFELASGGRREQILQLSKSVVALGISSIFVEAHDDPKNALCDGPSALPSQFINPFINQLAEIDRLVKSQPEVSIC